MGTQITINSMLLFLHWHSESTPMTTVFTVHTPHYAKGGCLFSYIQ